MTFQNTLDETTKIGYNRMTNQWDVGLSKKSGHYVPPEAKASEGDETKVIWKFLFIVFQILISYENWNKKSKKQ